MVTPDEIRKKAEKIFPRFLNAWLAGDEFFPCDVRCNKAVPDGIAAARQAANAVREQSKENRGFGYSIQWEEKNFRRYGRNPWPVRVFFASQSDLLKYLGKQREFDEFVRAVELARQQFPQLEQWLRAHPTKMMNSAVHVDGLLAVVQAFIDNPRPNCFARELRVAVPTKFVEQHEPILRQWLDLLLPSHAIRADETTHFARRFGLKYKCNYVFVRLLDPVLQTELKIAFDDFQLPLDAIEKLDPKNVSVWVVENEVPLRTLPALPRTIAFGRMGDAAALLYRLPWLQTAPITFWGDLDVEGLEGLSTFRSRLPQTRSFMMDSAALNAFAELASADRGSVSAEPRHLTPDELAAFWRCRDENLRLEQEHIPQAAVLAELERLDLLG